MQKDNTCTKHKFLTSIRRIRVDGIYKKADINFWLVTLVIALLFMVIVFFVMGGVFNIWGETTTKIKEEHIEKGLEEINIFGEDDENAQASTSSEK